MMTMALESRMMPATLAAPAGMTLCWIAWYMVEMQTKFISSFPKCIAEILRTCLDF